MLIRDIITEVSRVKMGTDDQGETGAWVSDIGRPEKTVQLPVNRIRVHEPDTKFNDPDFGKNLANIKAVLRRGEKLPPILVRRMPGEFLQYQVIDGHHRFKAYRDLGMKTIPARIVTKFNITDLTENMTINVNPKKNSFAVDLIIDGKSVGAFQYNQQTGRTIVELDSSLHGKGLGKLLILQGIYTAAKLGMDYIEDESRTAAFDNAMDSLADSGFIVNDDEYWYVTTMGEKYLQKSFK